MGGFTRSGSLIAAEAQDRKDMESAAAQTRRERFGAEVRRAIAVGFSEREAPFAAMARLQYGPGTVARIREHLKATMPGLYEDVA